MVAAREEPLNLGPRYRVTVNALHLGYDRLAAVRECCVVHVYFKAVLVKSYAYRVPVRTGGVRGFDYERLGHVAGVTNV